MCCKSPLFFKFVNDARQFSHEKEYMEKTLVLINEALSIKATMHSNAAIISKKDELK